LQVNPKDGEFVVPGEIQGVKLSYIDVLKEGMAGRASHGNGRGHDGWEDELWGGVLVWWNHGFHLAQHDFLFQLALPFGYYPPSPPAPIMRLPMVRTSSIKRN
jgi:hypothetical protein